MGGKQAQREVPDADQLTATEPEAPLPGPSRLVPPEKRLVDYEQTVGVVQLFVGVRFKLAAFLPALTGAAVALLSRPSVDWSRRVVLGVGGFAFTFGVVVYDLRNSQLHDSAIGRAKQLEKLLFENLGGDKNPGVFGSRNDTDTSMQTQHRDRFLRFPVGHDAALSLVYATTLAAWVWVVIDGARMGFQQHRKGPDRMLDNPDLVSLMAAGVAGVAGLAIYFLHRLHDAKR